MKKYFRAIIIQSIVWTLAYTFWALLRQFGLELAEEPPEKTMLEHALIYMPLGIISAFIFVFTDRFFNKKLKTNVSFGSAILISSLLYLLIFFMLIIIGVVLFLLPEKEQFTWDITFNYILSKEGVLLLAYFFIIILSIQFVKQVDKKFGPGNLLRMFRGEFYKPREVERIVMFLDLKSSTTIAEKIGHIKFSRLIQDCFHELKIVRKYQAEIYQYVGDEVVLIWEKAKGIRNLNCLQFYFAYSKLLNENADYYLKEYDVVPEFKCGSHVGKVIMTEIGQIKREIAYHGDVMNTASRIQDQCNKNGKKFLLSEALYNLFPNQSLYDLKQIDTVALKGKTQDVRIYSAELANKKND